MSHYTDIFKTPENQNWAKCWFASEITRRGLLEICKYELKNFHAIITSNLPIGPCKSCKVQDVIPYSKSHRCRPGQCNCPSKQCVLGICHILRTKIEQEHSYREISWKNTNVEEWRQNEWEVAKCYFPKDGYINKKTAEDTDLNGVLSFIFCNKLFKKLFSSANLQLCVKVS